jgi:hypothetical protein
MQPYRKFAETSLKEPLKIYGFHERQGSSSIRPFQLPLMTADGLQHRHTRVSQHPTAATASTQIARDSL